MKDDWDLLGTVRPSKHCEDKMEELVAYDHTGYARWKCTCGNVSGWEKIE